MSNNSRHHVYWAVTPCHAPFYVLTQLMFTRTMQGEFLLSRYASDEISILTKKRTQWQSQDSTCSGLSLLLFLFYHVFFIIFIFLPCSTARNRFCIMSHHQNNICKYLNSKYSKIIHALRYCPVCSPPLFIVAGQSSLSWPHN